MSTKPDSGAAEGRREADRRRRKLSFAAEELRKMGSFRSKEWILSAVFVAVCGLWATTSWRTK